MRKNRIGKKLAQRVVALALAVTLLVGGAVSANALSLFGGFGSGMGGYLEYSQKAMLYMALGDANLGMNYFDQLIQQDANDLGAYLARAEYRLYQGDVTGARQDCDYAIGHLTDNWSENLDVRMYGYSVRANVDFYMGDQAQYLSDVQAGTNVMNLLMGQVDAMYSTGVSGGESWQEMKSKAEASQAALNSWYNNGSPASTFQTEHGTVSGGVNDKKIQIDEAWTADEYGADATYHTTFELSQPIWNVTRRGFAMNNSLLSLAAEQEGLENGSVAFFVPAGTVVIMNQQIQTGRERAKTYTTFRASNLSSKETFDGMVLTVESGCIYKLDYASSDSIEVIFIAV